MNNVNILFKKYNVKRYYKNLKSFENFLSNKNLNNIEIIPFGNGFIITITYDLGMTFKDDLDTVVYNINQLIYLESLLTPLSPIILDNSFSFDSKPDLQHLYNYYINNKELTTRFINLHTLLKNNFEKTYFFNKTYVLSLNNTYVVSYKFSFENFHLDFSFNLESLKRDLDNFEAFKPIILNFITIKHLRED